MIRQKGNTVLIILVLFLIEACTTLPTPEHKDYSFPAQDAFIGDVKRPYQVMGWVKSKVNFQSLDPAREESDLCRNYFNKAVRDLVSLAKEKGGDAVIDVKSVVFLQDGHHETYQTPECSDDGMEGQSLAQGIAVTWKHVPVPEGGASPSPLPSLSPVPAISAVPPSFPAPSVPYPTSSPLGHPFSIYPQDSPF